MARYQQTILGTCCVPWDEDGTLAEAIFRDSIRHLIKSDLRDLYIFGTAGEGYAVDDRQFDTITRIFHDEMTQHGATPMVGVINQSLATVIGRIERAAALGVRAFQISLPNWGVLTPDETKVFFRETCGRFPQCQFLHYNLMRAGRIVTPHEYAALAQEYPNLVATKHGTGDLNIVNGLLKHAGELRHFFTEAAFAYGSLAGECGFLISIAASNPWRAREYFEAGVSRDAAKLMSLQRELTGMLAELIAAVSGGAHMDGAYDKLFAKLHDPRFPLRLLPPYRSTSDEEFESYRAALGEKFPQWLPA